MSTEKPQIDWDDLIREDRANMVLYHDPDVFEQELQKIWYRDWIFLAHESEIKEPGDYVTRYIGLEPLIVSRSENGEINLLLNRCRHRGATVCQLDSGNANTFRCVYHGWTYRNDGALVGVPFDRAYDPSFREEHQGLVRAPRVGVYRGFIFGSMSAEGESLLEFLGGAKEGLLDQLCDLSPEGEIEIRSGWLRDMGECNWKADMDQVWGAGTDHLQFVHRSQSKFLAGDTKGGTRVGRQRLGGSINAEGLAAFNAEAAPKIDGAVRQNSQMYDIEHGHRWSESQGGAKVAWVDVDNPHRTEVRYVEMMVAKLGYDKAKELLRVGPRIGTMWPGLFFANQTIMQHVPVSTTQTLLLFAFPSLKGAPQELNERFLRRMEGGFGPAGMVIQDDLASEERIQHAIVGRPVDAWVNMAKGIGEIGRRESSLTGVTAPNLSEHNEFGLRQIYNLYKEKMTRP